MRPDHRTPSKLDDRRRLLACVGIAAGYFSTCLLFLVVIVARDHRRCAT